MLLSMALVLPKLHCYKCGHNWSPRSDRRPALCPNCNFARFDDPSAVPNPIPPSSGLPEALPSIVPKNGDIANKTPSDKLDSALEQLTEIKNLIQGKGHGVIDQDAGFSDELRRLRAFERRNYGSNEDSAALEAQAGIIGHLRRLPPEKLHLVEALAWKIRDIDLEGPLERTERLLREKLINIAREYDEEAARARAEHQRRKA